MAGSGVSAARRVLGAALIILVAVPVHRLLAAPVTGLAGRATVYSADITYAFLWTGTLVVVLVALLAARLLPPARVDAALAPAARLLSVLPAGRFALFAGALAFVLSALFAAVALDGAPTHLDAFAQLLHARFVAAGMLAGPLTVEPAFWQIQNGVLTEHGWVSHYPPGHVLLLAAGVRLGAPWLVGPLMVGLCAYFSARIAIRLLPGDGALARGAALAVACSPFLVCLGGSYMNHAPAAMLLAAATWFALEAGDLPRRALIAGAAAGAAFTIRPWTALTIGAAVLLATWLREGASRASVGRRIAYAAAGALPFAAFVGAYNAWFFGAPTRFGYHAAMGPDTGLGFGVDPWGNAYGPVQALGYTASDLVALGGALLESPVSPVLAVALLLLLAPRLTHGERILAAWAIVPLAANALYWHHGLYMGPRMLFEAAPAWILLAAAGVHRAWSAGGRIGGVEMRGAVVAAVAVSLAFTMWLAPQRAAAHAPAPGDVTAVRVPTFDAPTLVFVHDGWTARLAMQLAATGMRLDSIETALRQNPTCDVQGVVDAIVAGDVARRHERFAALDLEPRADALPPTLTLATGSTIRIDPDAPPTAACARQAAADRNGILDLAPLVWRGDLPGAPARGTLYVRDLGPERNAVLIERMPERTPLILFTPRDGAAPVLSEYDAAIAALWGDASPAVAEAT